ncbi:MAG: hypothetical protein F9B45_15710 [Phycisphaera sp. RhM]|nr:hypothetical protein [Phycisphaera sp. RhM]
MSTRQLVIVVLLACGGLGCRDARNLSQQLDGTTDATYGFWVRLQGIKYRTAQKTHSIYVSNLTTARAQDLDALAKGFNAAASHHGQIARELELLDPENADSIAVDYRDQMVASHKNLQRQFRACADATSIGANYGGFAISRGYHQLTHHGKVPEYITELSVIEQFHMEQLARFLKQLKSVEEPNGKTLLDNCMVLFGSGMGNASSHSNKNLPLLLAGGGFRHGEHKSYFKDSAKKVATPAANLFVSMLQRFGMEIDQFGLSGETLSGLEVAS